MVANIWKMNKQLSSTYHSSIDVSDEISSEGKVEMCRSKSARLQHRLRKHGLKAEDLHVRFSSVSIREHAITIGDNPGGMVGPPLSIEWEHQNETTLPVDEYEVNRPRRRFGREMLIPVTERTDMLRRAGFGRKDIVRLTKPVNIARAQRKKTESTLNLSGLHMVSEIVSRKTLNAVTLGGRKRKERALLKKCDLPSTSVPVATRITPPPSTEQNDEIPSLENLSLADDNGIVDDSDEVEEYGELEVEC